MTVTAAIKRRRGRPPKDKAAFSETKAELIRSGMELLTEKGYSSTGIDEILSRVGVPKGSFYHYFGSKDAFGAELIQQYGKFFNHKLDKFLLDDALSPLERLDAFMRDAIAGMARYEFKRGCLVGNLGQEMGALPESYREQLHDIFKQWQKRVADCLEQAKSVGQIAANINCHEASYIFWIGWEGAVLRAKLERTPFALQAFSAYFFNSLK